MLCTNCKNKTSESSGLCINCSSSYKELNFDNTIDSIKNSKKDLRKTFIFSFISLIISSLGFGAAFLNGILAIIMGIISAGFAIYQLMIKGNKVISFVAIINAFLSIILGILFMIAIF